MPTRRAVVASDLSAQCDANAVILAAVITAISKGKPDRIRQNVLVIRRAIEAQACCGNVVPIRGGAVREMPPNRTDAALARLDKAEAILAVSLLR